MANAPLRIGILGAAHIAPRALIHPAREVPEVLVAAISARDPARARAYANKHGIPRVHRSYEALLADPEIDAIYTPLPTSLHCEWSVKGLQAGKHVLCEKPFASNAREAAQMAAAAQGSGRVLMEAFHWRYHPLAARMRAIVASGELGTVRHLEAHLCLPLLRPGDLPYRLELAGGATIDVGCYPINILRFLAAAEPQVVQAAAKLSSPGVDRYMAADFRFPDGRTGRITCALFSAVLLRASARVRGDRGELRVLNPVVPQFYHRLTVRTDRVRRTEYIRGDTTYTCQLRAFAAAVRNGGSVPTGPEEAIANMKVIDAVYTQAGMQPRG